MKNKCSLEELPVELRILILSRVSDLESLRSIVHASPACHQAYQRARGELLQNLLHKEYDGLVNVPDAVTAIRSKGLHASVPSNKKRIISLLDTRRRSDEIQRLGLPSAEAIPASIDETVQLLSLHRVMAFLLDDYCKSVSCPKWMDQTKWETKILPLCLSDTEKLRCLRGFYRLQIFANIFAPVELPVHKTNSGRKEDSWDRKTFTMEEAWRVLFGTMAPWEVVELGCMSQYMYERYAEPYTAVAESLAQYGQVEVYSLPELAPLPAGCIHSDATSLALHADFNLQSLAAMGPETLHKFLHQKNTFLDRRDWFLANGRVYNWVLPNICPGPEGCLPLLYPADRFNFGEDFDGLKELLAGLPPSERPNLLCDRYLLCYPDLPDALEEIFDERLCCDQWQWGFALWEDGRVREWNAPMDYAAVLEY